jgi:inorganic pyrophosphatase
MTFVVELPAFDESGELNAVIDTPKGSRNKYKLDEKRRQYRLSGVLPAGAVFPFDFGFVPSTRGGDGDPLDVLILMDEAAFTGCLIPARLIGVLEAEQTEKGKTEENDRLIAVASASHEYKDVKRLDQVGKNVLDEIEHFFVSYNEIKGKKFEVKRRSGPDRAKRIVDEGVTRYVSDDDETDDAADEPHATPDRSRAPRSTQEAPSHGGFGSHRHADTPEHDTPRAARATKAPRAKPAAAAQHATKRFGGPR